MHYARWQRTGDPTALPGRKQIVPPAIEPRYCPECSNEVVGRKASARFCSDRCCKSFNYRLNRAARRAANRRWKQDNPDKLRVLRKRYSVKNRDKKYAASKRWRENNPDSYQAARQRSRQRDPERHLLLKRLREQQRVARKRTNGGGMAVVTAKDWHRLLCIYRGRCAYCCAVGELHIEHVIPLARGGRHAIGNIVPACSTCNYSKGNRLLVEWRYGRRIPTRVAM